jgi:transcriptional regulator with XRE-family HTH domain
VGATEPAEERPEEVLAFMPRYQLDGGAVRAIREAAGLSRDETAVRAGMSSSYLTLIELGYRVPPADRLVALAAVLDCDVAIFFEKVATPA